MNRPWPRNTHQQVDGQHSSDAITDISLEWLKNGWDRERPFFLMHHFKAPHDMFQNAPRYDTYLEDVTIPEPANLHNQPTEGFGSVASRGFGSGWQKGMRAGNLAANEESMRMPFIVHYPKVVKADSTNDWLINNTDFAPTILALADIDAPDQMQGRSFASALNGEKRPTNWRTATYYHYWMHMAHNLRVLAHFGIRTERYKLIFSYGCTPSGGDKTPAAWELYDLQHDPSEMQNQYANPEYAEVVADLKRELWNTRAALNESDRDYPQIQAIIDAHKTVTR